MTAYLTNALVVVTPAMNEDCRTWFVPVLTGAADMLLVPFDNTHL